jgi:hypothetical protein
LGRLGINIENQRQGTGKDILNYLKTVDAYSRSFGFYEKNGFDYITVRDKDDDTRLMFFDLSTIIN